MDLSHFIVQKVQAIMYVWNKAKTYIQMNEQWFVKDTFIIMFDF